MLFEINLLTIIVMAALGGISTYLANQNIAVFHDGLRPLYSQYFSGAMDRRALFATSFALSFGLVIGFGIPTSIAGKIIIVHTILLGCDILGTLFSDSGNRKWIATAVGALFGILLLFGMQAITDIFSVLPIDFTGNLGNVGSLGEVGSSHNAIKASEQRLFNLVADVHLYTGRPIFTHTTLGTMAVFLE
jgi:hypothetical protein